MNSKLKGMSCSTPVNPFKRGNPFTPESDSSVDSSVNVPIKKPVASPLDPSVNIGSASHRFHYADPIETESQQDTNIPLIYLHTTEQAY